MIKQEHNNHCESIASLIDSITYGDMYKCHECGEFVPFDDFSLSDDEESYTCPNCGCELDIDDIEQVTLFDWAEDVLDVRYTFSSNRDLVGAEFLVAFGGPNIWVDTMRGEVRLNWWNDSGSADLTSCSINALEELAVEMWGC